MTPSSRTTIFYPLNYFAVMKYCQNIVRLYPLYQWHEQPTIFIPIFVSINVVKWCPWFKTVKFVWHFNKNDLTIQSINICFFFLLHYYTLIQGKIDVIPKYKTSRKVLLQPGKCWKRIFVRFLQARLVTIPTFIHILSYFYNK